MRYSEGMSFVLLTIVIGEGASSLITSVTFRRITPLSPFANTVRYSVVADSKSVCAKICLTSERCPMFSFDKRAQICHIAEGFLDVPGSPVYGIQNQFHWTMKVYTHGCVRCGTNSWVYFTIKWKVLREFSSIVNTQQTEFDKETRNDCEPGAIDDWHLTSPYSVPVAITWRTEKWKNEADKWKLWKTTLKSDAGEIYTFIWDDWVYNGNPVELT